MNPQSSGTFRTPSTHALTKNGEIASLRIEMQPTPFFKKHPVQRQLGFFIDQGKCTGCQACVAACRKRNNITDEPVDLLRVETVENGGSPVFLPVPCFHCATPRCYSVCPAYVITKRPENGVMVIDRKFCVGKGECGRCLRICPYKAPRFGPEKFAKVQKCDFCLDRWLEGKKPACVEACPEGALDTGPMDELEAKYGPSEGAEGFEYDERFKPSVIFRRKKSG